VVRKVRLRKDTKIKLAAMLACLVVGISFIIIVWSGGKERISFEPPTWKPGTIWVFDVDYLHTPITLTIQVIGDDEFDNQAYLLLYGYDPPLREQIGKSLVWVDKNTLLGIRADMFENDNLLSRMTIARTFSEPLWPLQPGKKLTMVENMKIIEFGEELVQEFVYEVKIEGPEGVKVEAGTFETLKLTLFYGGKKARVEWWSPQTLWCVKTEDEFFGILSELRSYEIA